MNYFFTDILYTSPSTDNDLFEGIFYEPHLMRLLDPECLVIGMLNLLCIHFC